MRRAGAVRPDADGAAGEGPDPVDIHVGARVRMRRRFLGVSQQTLADALGLTFQQVQKYERGANRVSASKLYEIARALRVQVAYFFEGLPDAPGAGAASVGGQERTVHDFLMTEEGLELAGLFPKLQRGVLRRRVLELVRAAADDEDGAGDR